MNETRPDIMSMTRDELRARLKEMGEPAFRADQLFRKQRRVLPGKEERHLVPSDHVRRVGVPSVKAAESRVLPGHLERSEQRVKG